MYNEFEYVYYAVRYVHPKEKSANTEQVNIGLDCGIIKDFYVCIYIFCEFQNEDNIMI